MPDWAPLRTAILHADRNAQRLALIEKIEQWLPLSPTDAIAACLAAAPDEAAARALDDMLLLVALAKQREHAPAGNAASVLRASLRNAWPAIATPPPPDPETDSLHAALAALQARQNEWQQYAVPGGVTSERMTALDGVLDDYRACLTAAAETAPVRVDICFFAAHAAYALGRGWYLLGRVDIAASRYAEAATLYAQAHEDQQAADAAAQARKLGFARSADIDGASVQELQALVAGEADPIRRARAHARLADLASAANDGFGAAEWSEKTAEDLIAAGFADPEATHIDSVFDGWIRTVTADTPRLVSPTPIQRINEAGGFYQAILGARHAARITRDPAGAASAEAALDALNATLLEALRQPAEARAAVVAALSRYMPGLDAGPLPSADDTLQHRTQALLQRLNAIQTEANAADDTGDQAALADLQRRSGEALVEARALGVLPAIGDACYMDAYVRLRTGDMAGAAAACLEGEATILAGVPPTPEALAGHPQLDMLLMLRRLRLQAAGAMEDSQALLACAEETVGIIEAQRYRVSDPFQQGAFLAGRVFFYEMAAFASFKLGRWDTLLSSMELFKSRAALINRLSPPPQLDETELDAKLAHATAALATAPPQSDAHNAAAEQRRLLLSLRAIARARAAGAHGEAIPTLSVAAVQQALAPDEAVVAWVWITPLVLLVLALDAGRVHAERVVLGSEDRALLDEYVGVVRSGRTRVAALDATVTRLAGVVLPPDTRQFIAQAGRLIFSPHRSLHLLPFHAAVFNGRFLIEQAAIRYVPNLGSLLVPWQGGSGGVFALGIGDFAVPGLALPPLKAAEAEARAVGEAWRATGQTAELLCGASASMAAFDAISQRLEESRCLHFATHGSSVLAKDAVNDPFASRLYLYDGAWDVLRLEQLRLGAEIVVLSACHSGQRALGGRGLEELPGDDVFGMQAAFFEAGACGVIGGLWRVDDASALLIVPALHAGLAAGTVPEIALQQAILAYLRRPDARRGIYFWAPLFLSSMGRGPSKPEGSQ